MQKLVKILACETCGKIFSKPSLLLRHSTTHSKDKHFQCAKCDKRFAQKPALKLHLQQHMSIKSFSCNDCGFSFSQKIHLQRHHQRVHTTKTKFACKKCFSYFKNATTLNLHLNKCHPLIKIGLDKQDEPEENDVKQIMSQLELLQTAILGPDMKLLAETAVSDDNLIDFTDKLEDGKGVTRKLKTEIVDGKSFCVCDFCAKKMKKPSDMIKHLRTHTRDKPFLCYHCDKGFTQKSSLTYHMNVNHTTGSDGKKYFCQICNQYFQNIEMLSRHSRVHSNESFSYQCTICFKVYDTYIQLRNHIKVHNKKEKLKTVAFTDDLAEKKFTCQTCERGFDQKKYLQQHELIHESETQFLCSHCGRTFTTKRNLSMHIALHVSEKRVVCEVCGMRFFTKSKLKRHLAGRHKSDTEAKTTETVQVEVINDTHQLTALTVPIITQEELEHFNFELVIPKESVTLAAATEETREKMTDTSKTCMVCRKPFKKPIDLRRHMRTHTKEKPFACQQCAGVFSLKCTLDKHVARRHQPATQPPIICGVCSKRFKSVASRNLHQRLHFDIRPFTCQWCQMKFRTSGHLTAHYQTHCNIYTKQQGAIALTDTRTRKYNQLTQIIDRFDEEFVSKPVDGKNDQNL